MSGSSHREPDRAAIASFVGALFAYADESTFVSLRVFHQSDKGKPPACIHGIEINGAGLAPVIDGAETIARLAANAPEPLVFCPPIATFTSEKQAAEDTLANGLAISVELDPGTRSLPESDWRVYSDLRLSSLPQVERLSIQYLLRNLKSFTCTGGCRSRLVILMSTPS